ncbi:hypothetical protein GCM10022200_26580 [Microbacterium awajiense]|uniref:DUF998 domain-containing protein n=1 Tax=Microbacterium awajiense TaxID=415214 RepID=A0ABP7AW36_9MICO
MTESVVGPRVKAVAGMDDESLAIVIAAVFFAATAIVALLVFGGRELPIDGRGSLGEFTALAGAAAAGVSFVVSMVLPRRRARLSAVGVGYRWFDVAALALAHGAIALLGWIGAASIMDHSFVGATVFATPASILAAAAAGLSAYLAFISAANTSAGQLSIVLAVFLVVGVVAAMLSATDPQWWQMNLSALGITHDISSLTFNVTLIISGVIVTTIARVGTAALPVATGVERRRRFEVRILFVLIGVLLTCVGIFPVDRFLLLHNTVATGMAVAYAVLVLGLPWFLPRMPRVFMILGFVYVAVIIALAVLFFTGIYNLTAVELVSAMLIFSWIILFLRNVQSIDGGAVTAASPAMAERAG